MTTDTNPNKNHFLAVIGPHFNMNWPTEKNILTLPSVVPIISVHVNIFFYAGNIRARGGNGAVGPAPL